MRHKMQAFLSLDLDDKSHTRREGWVRRVDSWARGI